MSVERVQIVFYFWNGESSVKVKMSTPGQEEDKKPGDQSVHINLKVKGQVSLAPL